jgi:hypothetical protein
MYKYKYKYLSKYDPVEAKTNQTPTPFIRLERRVADMYSSTRFVVDFEAQGKSQFAISGETDLENKNTTMFLPKDASNIRIQFQWTTAFVESWDNICGIYTPDVLPACYLIEGITCQQIDC